jgi:hypothetical protein
MVVVRFSFMVRVRAIVRIRVKVLVRIRSRVRVMVGVRVRVRVRIRVRVRVGCDCGKLEPGEIIVHVGLRAKHRISLILTVAPPFLLSVMLHGKTMWRE